VSVQQNHTGNLIKVAYFFAGIWYIFRVALTKGFGRNLAAAEDNLQQHCQS
jgi:hypothetical protein